MCETETEREKVEGGRKEGRKYVRWRVGGRWKERIKRKTNERMENKAKKK